MPKQKGMPCDEFFLKLYSLEKDLRHVTLAERICLHTHEGYLELLAKLKKENLRKEPFDLSFSSLNGMIAFNFYLPYSRCLFSDFSKSNLFGSDFNHADFYRANLSEVYFSDANLIAANFDSANLCRTDFFKTSLYGAKGLENNTSLSSAAFFRVGVTKKEKRIIEKVKVDNLFAEKY